jgi:hypothetical protein
MTIICGKCEKEMKEIELKEYEFEEGIILNNVIAMQCPSGHVKFTEEHVDILEHCGFIQRI